MGEARRVPVGWNSAPECLRGAGGLGQTGTDKGTGKGPVWGLSVSSDRAKAEAEGREQVEVKAEVEIGERGAGRRGSSGGTE